MGVAWDERMRARKTASFGVPFNYSGITYPYQPIPTRLAAIIDLLHIEMGMKANNCLANYYPNGDAKMGFHSDSTDHLAADSGIAIVSLGAPRTLTFCFLQDRSITRAYPLAPGSLLFMPLDVQEQWLHGLPADEDAGGRISLTFRKIVT